MLSAVLLSLIGRFWPLHALDYNLSIAVWVGIIALAGLSAETGVVMLLYLDRACAATPGGGTSENARGTPAGRLRRRGPKVRPVVMLSGGGECRDAPVRRPRRWTKGGDVR